MKSTTTLGFKFERTIPDGDRGSAGVPRAFVAHSHTGLLRGFSRAAFRGSPSRKTVGGGEELWVVC